MRARAALLGLLAGNLMTVATAEPLGIISEIRVGVLAHDVATGTFDRISACRSTPPMIPVRRIWG